MAMGCTQFEADRVLKASGETSSADFDRHVASCASCQADVAEFRDVARLYHDTSTERLPARVVAAVHAATDVRRFQRAMRMIGGLAAAAIVASLLWMLLLRTDAPAPVDPRPPVALKWEETTPAGEFLIVLDLDDRLRAARIRAAAVIPETNDLDRDILDLKSRVAAFRVTRDGL